MKRLFTVLFLVLPIFCSAQAKQGQARLDSLVAEVPKMKEDTAGVLLLDWIAYGYRNINPDEGLRYGRQQLALAQKIRWKRGEALAYDEIGTNNVSKSEYPAGLEAYLEALTINEARGDKRAIGISTANIGMVYQRRNNFSKSLEYYQKSLKIFEELGDKNLVKLSLNNIGGMYLDQHKSEEALAYLRKSLAISEELHDRHGVMLGTENIGNAYQQMKHFPEALAAQFQALRIAEQIDDKQNRCLNLGNIGGTYYDIAKDSIITKPDSLVQKGKSANLAMSIEYLKLAIAAGREIDFNEGVMAFSADLSDALAMQGDYSGALAAYKQFTAVKDSQFNTSNNEKITNLETKRAVELKDKDIQIATLKKRHERIFSIAGFAVLLLIMGILFRSFKRQQHSNVLLAKEKQRSDDLLLNILPAEVAEELKDHGSSAAKQYGEVSVLFTDFVDFTGTAEKLSPHQLVQELNECFTAFDAIIERNGLEKIKTIGDAYMAVCGLPVSAPLHAKKTVQAAIEIRDFIADRKKQEQVFEIRIGINSGSVVAGIVGVKKFAYDIWGDTVNTAARMEQHSKAGRINISHSTYELVKDDFRCEYRGKIAAKNKGEVEMYFVEAGVSETA
ncbi:MAG: adenylate/guanylate cyclase domain-containing protein [Chitinophagaceae bacterium]